MTQTIDKSQTITIEEFIQSQIEHRPYESFMESRQELHKGKISEMPPPKGKHEQIIGFLTNLIVLEYHRLGLPYLIGKTVYVKALHHESLYLPDLLVLNQTNLSNEPLWESASIISQGASIPLVVEVVTIGA